MVFLVIYSWDSFQRNSPLSYPSKQGKSYLVHEYRLRCLVAFGLEEQLDLNSPPFFLWWSLCCLLILNEVVGNWRYFDLFTVLMKSFPTFGWGKFNYSSQNILASYLKFNIIYLKMTQVWLSNSMFSWHRVDFI